MRQITNHVVNECNDKLKVEVVDEPGSGGASHLYKITGFDSTSNPSCPWQKLHGSPAVHAHVLFQQGPIKENGTNGLTHEVLLAILEDRLASFQAGPYACAENGIALEHIRHAQSSLQSRTRERLARGVEGTHKV